MYENYQTELSNLRHETKELEHKYQRMAENFESRLKDLGKSLETSEDNRFYLTKNWYNFICHYFYDQKLLYTNICNERFSSLNYTVLSKFDSK